MGRLKAILGIGIGIGIGLIGPALALLREGPNPAPHGTRPQLLFSRSDSLLRFDPDGTGPRVSQVVAILAGWRTLPPTALRFEPGR